MGAIGGDELARWERTEGAAAAAAGGGGREERILVSVRLRPLSAKELERNDPSDWECINTTTVISKNSVLERSMYPTAYTFDSVFGCQCTTRQVYEEGAKEVALSVVSGINSSIFAYGQTSSGKTYTMTGITEYSVGDIYNYIQKHTEREFVLKFSAMEIYNEAVKDLLSTDSTPLRLLDDPEKGTVVEKLTEETLRDQSHLQELLSVCEAQRQIGETSLNEMSSRSHQILRLTIESSAREFLGKDNSSSLAAAVNFVDLAGSERASQALTAGTRLKEGCHINRSLLTLGTVIRKLSKGKNGHIPYRDSKLTRILQHSLGGNARTAIICTMSPARSHIEQSRNTLLFASCAKEVATNAQVNVVMSDKALLKHLQRELARLENELRFPGLVSHSEALKERDSQIKKMEKEMKELMQQRDLAQSRLEDLLRAVGDDQASRQWDELSQYSIPHEPIICEDVFSISETSGVSYHIPDFDLTCFEASNEGDNQDEHHLQLSDKFKEQHAASPRHSVSSPRSVGLIPRQAHEEIAQENLEDSEHCKEVWCIEVDESSTLRGDEFNVLLTEDTDSVLPPSPDDNMHEDHETIIKGNADPRPALEQQLQSARKTIYNLANPYPDEASPCSSVRDFTSSRGWVLARSRSCRAALMTSSASPWFQEVEQDNNTPPSSFLKDLPGNPGEVRRRKLSALNYDAKTESSIGEGYQTPEQSTPLDVLQPQNTKTPEEGLNGFCNYVVELTEMAQIQYEKKLTDGQETEWRANESSGDERTVKDIGTDPIQNPSESPSRWPLEFETKQKEIIGLWHACHVSLVHRTCFFLLFKGDPADSIYMEVEHRRLSFLKSSFCGENLYKPAYGDDHNTTLSPSMRCIRREREMLRKQLYKRLSVKERERLYTTWGIALNSKQRRLQLSRLVWSDTNVDHVKESASLVAKLIGLLEPGQAFKEMFGLNFAPRLTTSRSHGWKHGVSSFK